MHRHIRSGSIAFKKLRSNALRQQTRYSSNLHSPNGPIPGIIAIGGVVLLMAQGSKLLGKTEPLKRREPKEPRAVSLEELQDLVEAPISEAAVSEEVVVAEADIEEIVEVVESVIEESPIEEESEIIETPSVEDVPVESAPVEDAPVEDAPIEVAAVEVEAIEVEVVEVEAVEAAPVEDEVVEVEVVEVAAVEVEPVEAAPVEAAPVEDAAVEAAPVEIEVVEVAPVEDAPVEVAPVIEVVEEVVELVVEEVIVPTEVEEVVLVTEVEAAPIIEEAPLVTEEVAVTELSAVEVEVIALVAEVAEAEEAVSSEEAIFANIVEPIAEEPIAAESVIESAVDAIVEASEVIVEAVTEVLEVVIPPIEETVVEVAEPVQAVEETPATVVPEEQPIVEAIEAAIEETVEAVVAVVEETVEAVVEEIASIEAAIEETVVAVEAVVEETVVAVEAAVEETVVAVEAAVEETVAAVEAVVEEIASIVDEIVHDEAVVVEVPEISLVEEVAVVEEVLAAEPTVAEPTVVDAVIEPEVAIKVIVSEVTEEASETTSSLANVVAEMPQIQLEEEAAIVAEVIEETTEIIETVPEVLEVLLEETVEEPVQVVEEIAPTPVEAVPVAEEAISIDVYTDEIIPVVAEVSEVTPVFEAVVAETYGDKAATDEIAAIPEEVVADEPVEVVEVIPEVIPIEYPEVPPEIPYLIVGGGTAAYSAIRAIRKYDPAAKILVVSDEDQAPYNRTPLSKELWFANENQAKEASYEDWRGSERSVYHEKLDFYCTGRELQAREDYGGTALLLGASVVKLNPDTKTAVLANGTEIKYEKCLLSIGGKPKNLPVFEDESMKENVTLFRNLGDFWKLDELAKKGGDIVVVGSGFLGTELAYALGDRSKNVENLKVTQICRETGVLGAVLPQYLSEYASEALEKEGVHVVRNAEITEVTKSDKLNIKTEDGRDIPADHVVVAVGVDIDHSIAEQSGLEYDSRRGGLIVNSELESRRDIYVAGDAANFYDQRLGRRRVEHYDHAIVTGRLAGENMTGKRKAYTHQSMFWSDIGPDIGFEAMGLVDSKLKSIGVFAESDKPLDVNLANPTAIDCNKYDKGVVFYLRQDIIVGVVTWNIFGKMGIARRLIALQNRENDFEEIARLFNVHKE